MLSFSLINPIITFVDSRMWFIRNIFLFFIFLFFIFLFHNCAPLAEKGTFVEETITVSGADSHVVDQPEENTGDDDDNGDGGGNDDNDDDPDPEPEPEPIGEEFNGSETEDGGEPPITTDLH